MPCFRQILKKGVEIMDTGNGCSSKPGGRPIKRQMHHYVMTPKATLLAAVIFA